MDGLFSHLYRQQISSKSIQKFIILLLEEEYDSESLLLDVEGSDDDNDNYNLSLFAKDFRTVELVKEFVYHQRCMYHYSTI